MTQQGNMHRKSLSLVLVVLAVVVLLLFNLLANVLVDRFGWTFDMTQNQLFELTDTSVALLNSMDEPVTLTVVSKETGFSTEVKEVINRIAAASDEITVKYVDPYSNPTFITSYEDQGIYLSEQDILVSSEKRATGVYSAQLYELNESQTAVTGFLAEQKLVSAIQYVITDELPSVLFTDGHGESPDSTFESLFTQNNFTTQSGSLSVSTTNADVELIVICGPENDFTAEEIAQLDDFLSKRGGKLMVYLNPAAADLPNLYGFLEEWGIRVSRDVVFEPSRYLSGTNQMYTVAYFTQHDITADLWQDNNFAVVMPVCRVLEALFTEKNGITTAEVLSSSVSSYGKDVENITTNEKEQGDAAGAFSLAMTATAQVTTDEGAKTAQVFVSGTNVMNSEQYLNTATIANKKFVSAAISWCAPEIQMLDIPVKDKGTPSLYVTIGTVIGIGVGVMIVIPVVILVLGFLVWRRRKHA